MQLAIAGTLLVVASALVTGPFISHLEKQVTDLEGEISEGERLMLDAHDAIQRSYQHFFPADIKLLILQTSQQSADHPQALMNVARGLLQGIIERYLAANGVGPSDERFKEIEAVALRAGRSDSSAFDELNKISAGLMEEWVSRHGEIARKRNANKVALDSLKARITKWRNRSVSLQILGLVVVLFKDVGSM